MPTLESIEEEIKTLPRQAAKQLQDWLADYLDDQEQLDPEFAASIERGKNDISQERTRVR